MKKLSYASWLKTTYDFAIRTEIIGVIADILNQKECPSATFSFNDYPPDLKDDVELFSNEIQEAGFQINAESFCAYLMYNGVKCYIGNVNLPKYGKDSFVRFINCYEIVAQQFDFVGDNFVALTISVKSSENIFLTGGSPILRNWNPFNPLPFLFMGGRGGPFWELVIPVIPGETIEFKLVYANGQYEPGPNRTYTAKDVDDSIFIDAS